MRCPNCNAWVGEDEVFCGECGTRITQPATPPAEGGGAARTLLGGSAAAVVIIGVVVVVACLCLVVACFGLQMLGAEEEPTPTNTPVRATNTPVPRPPTATPVVVVTSPTTQPSPTTRPSPTRPPTPSTAGGTFTDDFSTEAGGWELTTGTRGKAYIAEGELHVEVTEAQSIFWAVREQDTWGDVTFEADARQVSGPDSNDYGLMFRYKDKQNFYRFVISGEGRYRVSKYVNGQWGTLVDWKSSSAIKKGAATNHLKVIGKGDAFDLYVNDEKVDSFTDSDLDVGGIGVEAGSYSDGGVHVAFDNVRVSSAEVAFHDDMTDNKNTWPVGDTSYFENGEYHLFDKASAHVYWNSDAGIHDDFTLEAKIRKVEGPDSLSYGIVFRLLDGDNYYAFFIRGDGRYRLDKQVDDTWESIISVKQSDAVLEGNRANVLRLVCKGQTIELYVNGQKVDSAQDSFLSEGKIGFYMSQDVHIAVDYVTVWRN